MRMESPLNQRLRWSPPDVVYTPIDVTSFFEKIRGVQTYGGAVPSPFDCWLVLRGIRTLPYRIRAQSDNAVKVAAFLSRHAQVEEVHYPGLKSHQGHEIAARQMAPFGGMASFQVKGNREGAMTVASKVRLFTRATSLGGPESLIEHRASIEGGYVNRCVNDIRRRPSQPLIQWRFHPHTVHRGRRLRSTQGPSDA